MEETAMDIMEDNAILDYVDAGDNEQAWGVPVTDLDLSNLSDIQYLSRILGPRRMGYQVRGYARLSV